MTTNTTTIVPVILCGGSGTRLWPISREDLPKQFLAIAGDDSLLQRTVDRALACSGAKADQVMVVTLDSLKREVTRQLNEMNPDLTSHVLGEPVAKNTAAAVAYAAAYAARHFGTDSLMWILASDHHIGDEPALKAALDKAVVAAGHDYLVTFGIEPSRPETGYGYIARSQELTGNDGVYQIARFVEKPNLETAEQYVASGEYLWNSGMFLFRTGAVLDAFRAYAPQILSTVERAMANGSSARSASMETYKDVPEQPFDVAIMEKCDRAAVVPCDLKWSDVGSWESVWEISDKNADGNVMSGRVAAVQSKNCLIRSDDNRLVACVGLENVVVADTGDAVLVADRRNGDAMKVMVKALKGMGCKEVKETPKEARPWGMFKVLSETAGYKIKEIVVKPGQRLSLQMHNHRAEFWVVISGEAIVTVDESEELLKAGEFVYIPLRAKHRLANPGTTDLKIVEVQCGDYLGEDDIVRFDDIYGRTAAAA